MSLKHELEVWLAALEAFDAHEYDSALARFEVRFFFEISGRPGVVG